MTAKKKILIIAGVVLVLAIAAVALTRTTEDGSGPPPVPSPDGNYVVQASSYLRHRPFRTSPAKADPRCRCGAAFVHPSPGGTARSACLGTCSGSGSRSAATRIATTARHRWRRR